MRPSVTNLFIISLILIGTGCQNRDLPATTTATAPSPSPTPRVGVAFVTVTPGMTATATSGQSSEGSQIAPTATVTPEPVIYSVQTGDTLVDIAGTYGISLEQLLAMNPDVQPELLMVGQELLLPPAPTAEAPITETAEQPLALEIIGPVTYNSAAGGIWVLGEVRNDGQESVELVQVEVDLYDGAENLQSTETLWVTPITVDAGQKVPFGVLFSDVAAMTSRAVASVVASEPVVDLGNRYYDLAVDNAEVTIGRSPIEVAGELTNLGQQPASQISIVATFYDDAGVVTGFREVALEGTLLPGQSMSFRFTALPPGGRADEHQFAIQAFVAE